MDVKTENKKSSPELLDIIDPTTGITLIKKKKLSLN